MLRSKYAAKDWIINTSDVKIGYIVAFMWNGIEKHGEVIDVLGNRLHLSMTGGDSFSVDVFETTVFIINRLINHVGCSCGARFTSQPSWHLSYCDMYKK